MAEIKAAQVKELRDRTGLGMMECKKALQESNGDIDLAIENLRKSSGLKAAKKSARVASEGVVAARISEDSSFGLLIEINSETDFVAKDDNFLQFVDKVANEALAKRETNVETLMAGDLEAAREALVQKIGENIQVRRAVKVEAPAGAMVGSYVHNSKIGVLTVLENGNDDLAKDVAIHVVAVGPTQCLAEDIDEAILNKEKEIILAQPDMANKPDAVKEKMVEGRIKKFIAETTLVEQPFLKNNEFKVGEFLAKEGAKILSFIRLDLGEGIEKEEVDFAAEVRAQVEGR